MKRCFQVHPVDWTVNPNFIRKKSDQSDRRHFCVDPLRAIAQNSVRSIQIPSRFEDTIACLLSERELYNLAAVLGLNDSELESFIIVFRSSLLTEAIPKVL